MRLCQMYNGLISYICSMYEKNPEEETFKTFFLKYHDVLVLYAASILKNVDAAEDVVLGCFVQAWESSLYKKLSDGLDKYMFHVVKNAALNELRDCKRRKTRHEKMMEGMPVAEIMHEDEQTEIDVLYFAINQLPPERRRIFMMVYAEGKKYKEVAEHLQISINTVRTQLSRSLKFLPRHGSVGHHQNRGQELDPLRYHRRICGRPAGDDGGHHRRGGAPVPPGAKAHRPYQPGGPGELERYQCCPRLQR